MKVVITAGGTSEKIDNVRKITNSSTGKLGLCIANEFLKTVEEVEITYICSKETFCPNDDRVKIKRIIGVDDLEREVRNVLENNDIDVFIHSHKQPCNIRRTARTVKPCLTFCLQMGIILSLFTFPWINLQCIRIKELCSALRHSNQNRIV